MNNDYRFRPCPSSWYVEYRADHMPGKSMLRERSPMFASHEEAIAHARELRRTCRHALSVTVIAVYPSTAIPVRATNRRASGGLL